MKHHNECSMSTSYRAARRYDPAHHSGSTSVHGRILSPHSSGGLQGGAAYSLWRSWPGRLGQLEQTDRRTDGSRYRLTPPTGVGANLC